MERNGKELAPQASRNGVWDALAAIFGEPSTETNRSLRGKLVRSLNQAGADEDEIRRRVELWPLHFPDATLTETAFEKHYDRLGRPPLKASTDKVRQAEEDLRRLQRRQEAADRDRKALP